LGRGSGEMPNLGQYEYRIDMVDAAGNGWHLVGYPEVKQ